MIRNKNKYLVIKQEDIRKYLSPTEQNKLYHLITKIYEGRVWDGKKANSYMVVNEDEPYAEKVWHLIEEGE